LASVVAGPQSKADGWLLCLECGRWYRNLGCHAAKTHDTAGPEYRRRHQLPAVARLVALDLRERAADSARAQYPHNRGFQQGPDPATLARSVRQALDSRRESSTRIGSRLALEQHMAARSARILARTAMNMTHAPVLSVTSTCRRCSPRRRACPIVNSANSSE
jgi:hypothetical protein